MTSTRIGALGVLLALLVAPAPAAEQGRAQRRCVVALQRDGVGVAAAQAQRNARCLAAARAGREPDLEACVGGDPGGRVARATAKTAADAVRRCADPADFGVPNGFELTIDEAAITHLQGLVTDLFGPAPTVATRAGDRAGARCQRAALMGAQAVIRARGRAFVACVRTALRRGASDADDLAACVTNEPPPRIARTGRRTVSAVDRACGGSEWLAGTCGEAGSGLGTCVAARATCRACRLAATAAALDVDCDLVDDGSANASCEFPVSLAGNAIPFIGGPLGRVVGAEVWILEPPELRVTTGEDGGFRFDGLPEGSEATLVLEHPEYHPIQTGTIRLGARGAERVTFQAVTYAVYDALAALVGVVPDEENLCQMVTTVTRVGRSIYDEGAHGEAGVTVRLAPTLAAAQGPIYFNASVLPDRSLVETSEDGGVLFIQAAPGEYRWTGFKTGMIFTRVTMKCRPGLLVNASPPWGLQAH